MDFLELHDRIDRSVINESERQILLASQRVFQELATGITSILQDSSKLANPEYSLQDSSIGSKETCNLPKLSGNNNGTQTHNTNGADGSSSERRREVLSQISPIQIFERDNVRARKSYAEKRKRSLNLFGLGGASHLSREYDFQCGRFVRPLLVFHY